MSMLIEHVVGAMCDSFVVQIKPRFGKFSNDLIACTQSDRAAKPENFAKAGFFFGIVPHVWGRLAYIRRAQAPVTRQDTNGEGGRRLEPVGSAFMASSLVRSICDGMAPTRMYKRGCDLHGNGFACSEIHQRGYLT